MTYDASTNEFVVPQGVADFTVTIETNDDTEVESQENFTLTVGGQSGVTAIADNDSGVTSVSPAVNQAGDIIIEGDKAIFTVNLSNTTASPQMYSISLGANTDQADSNDYNADLANALFSNGVIYDAVNGKITVPVGVDSFTVSVETNDDTLIENAESFTLVVADRTGLAIVNDNDKSTIDEVTLNNTGDTVTEGETANFTVTLSEGNTTAQTYNVATFFGDANTAVAADIASLSFSGTGVTDNNDGTVTVEAGVTSFDVNVATFDDTLVESSETFQLQIDGTTYDATATILDNDKSTIDEVTLNNTGDTVTEGETANFTVTLSEGNATAQTYNVATFFGDANTAVAADIASLSFSGTGVTDNNDGTVTVEAGVTSFDVNVATFDDTLVESSETFQLQIDGTTYDATATIIDNDAPEIVLKNPVANVSEEGLADGNRDDNPDGDDTTDNSSFVGEFTIPDVEGINYTISLELPDDTIKSGGSNVVWSYDNGDVVGSVGEGVDAVSIIRIELNDVNDTTGSYTVTLLEPVDHPDVSIEDTLSLNFGITITDGSLESTKEVNVIIEDDSPNALDAQTDALVLSSEESVADSVLISNIIGGFGSIQTEGDSHSSQFKVVDNDADSLIDLVSWDDRDDDPTKIQLVDTDDTVSGSIDSYLILGQFTHTNSPINSGTKAFTESELSYTFTVNIAGSEQEVTLTADLFGEYTFNDQVDSDDRMRLELDETTSTTITVDGTVYKVELAGFQTPDGGISNTLVTKENESQSADVVASISVVSAAQTYSTLTGIIELGADFGADGAGSINAEAYTNSYGTFVINVDGTYSFTPSKDFGDSIGIGESQEVVLDYTVTDNDGDNTNNQVTITVSHPDTRPEAVNDTTSGDEDTVIIIDVLSNDKDEDNDELSIISASLVDPSLGTVSIVDDQLQLTPTEHYSGQVEIEYTIRDEDGLESSANVTVDVIAVADTPIFTPLNSLPIGGDGLTKQVWTGVFSSNWGGEGQSDIDTLEAFVEAETASSSNTSSLIVAVSGSTDEAQGTLTLINGFVFLEAGKEYQFSGHGDDSLYIRFGSDIIADANWGDESGLIRSQNFEVDATGYYPVEIAHHNQNGPGNYEINIVESGQDASLISTDNFSLFSSISTLESAGIRLGAAVEVDGELDHYRAYGVNEGDENTNIPLEKFSVNLVDLDGSEQLTVSVSGGQVGSVLSDGEHSIEFNSSTVSYDVTGWNFENLTVKVLSVDTDESFELNFVATATETSNLVISSTTKSINLTVYESSTLSDTFFEDMSKAISDDIAEIKNDAGKGDEDNGKSDFYDGKGNDEDVDSHITGTSNNDLIDGNDENDHIEGFNAQDTLIGGTGNDWVEGGDGDDFLLGGGSNHS
ncbi:RTX-I toxin determinant A from serotypes 1/9 [Marinomonas gallaica]|uniref:RTX-I toxin determinant A from serotypes 1/9 n=1 Tax=Marinomonas gallaica TaxID=1806667 RepID=A0A1C3JVB9_9GAMM|nr:RTX-I toxin determinant A from serotypes 1/9 [Marinomonas gallaica]